MTELLSQHRELLKASAITDAVIAARGYWSARTTAELERLGYRRNMAPAPALVIPTRGVGGEVVGYQIRPDVPPMIDGRIAKYLSPPGAEVRLDVPPACRKLIGSPNVALWVTEGAKKGDALASAGLTAIDLAGVQMFRCEDWERVPLDGRRVIVAFDSDVMVKPQVHAALQALSAHLAARGATVGYCYLPIDEAGKIGIDDYLAAKHTVEDLYALIEDELRPPPVEPEPKRASALPTAHLLDVIEGTYRRFVRFSSEHEPVALALFTTHTYALEAAQATPYVFATSPEKRSGKTRLLEVAELVVREPIRAANITAAGVFQAIEAWTPTLMADELDAVFVSKSDQAEALRAVLNAGNRRGSYVIRGTHDGTPARFGTFCPKLLAGIDTGKLPDTIRDRSIVIHMQRRRPDECVEDLFPVELAEQLDELRRRLEDWAAEHIEALAAWRRSERVPGLDDRLQEAWDPLIAISHLAGTEWAKRARAAATALAKGGEDASEAAHGHVLIDALRSLFADKLALASQSICSHLNIDEEAPWSAYNAGAGIKPRDLAKLLRPYGIKSKQVRVGTATSKGYHRDDFGEVWQRYGPSHTTPSIEREHGKHPKHRGPEGAGDVSHVSRVSFPDRPPAAGEAPSPDGAGARTSIDYAALARPIDVSKLTHEQRLARRGRRRREHERELAAGDPVLDDLVDEGLLAAFPGATIETRPGVESVATPCGCHQRKREWRLPGAALDIALTYVSNAAHREAIEQGTAIIPKGPRSGWSIETSQSGHGHRWICALCHPPAGGLEVEYGDAPPREEPALLEAMLFAIEWNVAMNARGRKARRAQAGEAFPRMVSGACPPPEPETEAELRAEE